MPCGVESDTADQQGFELCSVPNVPCGVESCGTRAVMGYASLFLMCRVELKVWRKMGLLSASGKVPNVPCGVERRR